MHDLTKTCMLIASAASTNERSERCLLGHFRGVLQWMGQWLDMKNRHFHRKKSWGICAGSNRMCCEWQVVAQLSSGARVRPR